MRYLVYIDILGFSELVQRDASTVEWLYSVIDDLNAHRHHAFKTIVFSDTVLIYSDLCCSDESCHEYMSMYAIEFSQDLFYRISRRGLFFRAVIDYGDFEHSRLRNCEKFYGTSLIRCYQLEKEVPCIGTFITEAASQHQNIFPMSRYTEALWFVYFQQNYYRFSENYKGWPNLSLSVLDQELSTHLIAQEMYLFKILTKNAREHALPNVRQKYQAYLEFYRSRYPWPLNDWQTNGFGMQSIGVKGNWRSVYRDVIAEQY
ncbi:hypothetical protein [Thiocystis violascens]|uniref:Guanylate cyclase domain-containing protein n=1 Tax=Thiocystis violascens (strain ATCC 17096 / DSM 198 / 6111) TaxID=765911 RepID=I3Y8D9_THIV6|nr:hypothetical protein [Thiocystis violascens]AFL73257.1 hypothetical protein Thivi_1234 [Thiocystis violascens DSM 198]